MSLTNITMRQYSRKRNVLKYDSLLSSLVGENIFLNKKFELSRVSYSSVRKIEKLLRTGKTFNDLSMVFQLAFGVTDEEFFKASIVDFFRARNFLKSEVERLINQEKNLLKSDGVNADLWEQAGGKSLAPLAEIIPLVKLGKIYGIYPFDLGDKPYNEIMALLVTHKRTDAVDAKYNELTRPKK